LAAQHAAPAARGRWPSCLDLSTRDRRARVADASRRPGRAEAGPRRCALRPERGRQPQHGRGLDFPPAKAARRHRGRLFDPHVTRHRLPTQGVDPMPSISRRVFISLAITTVVTSLCAYGWIYWEAKLTENVLRQRALLDQANLVAAYLRL